MLSLLRKDKKAVYLLILFVLLSSWWLYIRANNIDNQRTLDLFAGTYGVIALIGGVWGIFIAKKWGGFKSVIGRAVLFFAIGLLAQEFGQLAYAYYAVVQKVEIPYPSIGDIGYFGSVLCYIYATWQLAKAAGIKFSLKDTSKKIIATLLPLLLLVSSYFYFLRGYEFDFSSPSATLAVILDFGYPLGQALYIAIALLTYLLSKNLLGGIMKNKVLLLLFALLIQYIADFNFLFQANRETWTTAGYGDYLYLLSYFVMSIAILNMSPKLLKISNNLKESSSAEEGNL